jgi:anti-sigma regulatory factor (Ser/Thr protein kinase)
VPALPTLPPERTISYIKDRFFMNDAPDLPSLVRAEQTLVRLPSRPHWIEETVDYLCRKAVLCGACQETRSKKLMVALQEGLINSVVHGNLGLSSELKERGDSSFAEALAQRAADPNLSQRMVDIVVDYDGQRCRWLITDEGKGFDVEGVLRRLESDDPELLLASGRGILLMRSFLDEVKYEAGGRRLILTLHRQSGEEKRQQTRVDAHQPVQIVPIRADGSVDWEAAYQAVSLNFSEQGMGLLQERLATTDRIIIGIYANNQALYVPAEVRHCRSLGGDVMELGCRFQTRREAPKETVASLPSLPEADLAVQGAVADLMELHQGLPPGAADRRVHPRVVFNARLEVCQPPSTQVLTAFARDLSKGGMSFITTTALAGEVVLTMHPQEQGPPLRIRAQIVRCNKVQEGFFDVGARFFGLVSGEW